jgi:plasmid stabilization system protein ParE
MTSRFLSAAEAEFADAGAFYEAERVGLGDDFFETVRAAVGRLEEIPEMGSPLDSKYRSVVVLRFPFRIVYRIAGGEIVIVAVAHQSRRPEYWRDRV